MLLGTDDVLEALLSPIGRQVFRSEYWNKRPLYLSGGCARAAGLGVTLASFWEAIRPSMLPSSVAVKAQYFDAQGAHREMLLPRASTPLAPDLLDAGMTLCVGSFDRLSGPVEQLSRALAATLGIPEAVDVACYVSGQGRGFGLHFDDTPIFVVQCEGSKRWLFSGTSFSSATLRGGVRASEHAEVSAFVRRHPGMRLSVPRDEELEECVLQPNDLLYLPAGTWHRTYAEDVSVALTFSLSSRRIDEALAAAIGQKLIASSARSAVLSEPPAAVDLTSWVAARLPELLVRASALEPATLAEAIAGRSSLAEAPESTSAPSTEPSSPIALTLLRDDSVLLVENPAAVAVFTAPDEEGNPRTFVYRGNEGLQLPAACAPMLHAALAQTRCTLAELRSWLVADLDVKDILLPLLELGVLHEERGRA